MTNVSDRRARPPCPIVLSDRRAQWCRSPGPTRDIGAPFLDTSATSLRFSRKLASRSADWPDGYVLLLGDSSLLIAARAMQNLTFDPITSFVPVAGVAIAPLAIALAADSPLRSLEDIAKAANAGQTLTFATSG